MILKYRIIQLDIKYIYKLIYETYLHENNIHNTKQGKEITVYGIKIIHIKYDMVIYKGFF